MSKQRLIRHLENDIFCRLGISKVSGIGVIAIKDIPINTNPFTHLAPLKDKAITLNNNDLKHVDKNVKKVINDFFGTEKEYDVLAYGPNYMNISYYLNHSNNPNLDVVNDISSDYFSFRTNRKIKKGEELFINYKDYS